MNRQGKSMMNELLTQLGIPTTKKTGMDVMWVDETPRDLIGTHISHLPSEIQEMSYEDKQRILEELKRASMLRMYEVVQQDVDILFPSDMKAKGTTKKLRNV
jgi:hypothetical protein